MAASRTLSSRVCQKALVPPRLLSRETSPPTCSSASHLALMSTKSDAASAMAASPITPCDLQPLPRAVTRPVTRHDEKILVEEFIKNYHPEDFWGATAQHAEAPQPKPRRRICGIPPIIFWMLVAVLVIATAAAVGGGVGGAMSNKSDHYDVKRSAPRHHGLVSSFRLGARHLDPVVPTAP